MADEVASTMTMSITWFVFLIIILLSITFLVKSYVQIQIESKPAEAALLTQEIIYGKGIAYQDPTTGRIYPGIIDLNAFNSATIENMLSYGSQEPTVAANITLLNPDSTTIKSIIYQEQWFVRWKPLVKVSGSGAASAYRTTIPVTLRDVSQTKSALIVMEVVYPNK